MDRLNSRREGTEETVSELEERTAEISQPVQHQENKWRALRDLRNYDKKSTSKWLQSWRKRTKKAQVKKYSNIMAENVPNLARDKPTDLSWANVTQDIPQATNAKVKVLVTQSCLTLCDPVDCSPPGSSVRGILQARILEWGAIPFSRDLPKPGIEPGSPALQAGSLPSLPQNTL